MTSTSFGRRDAVEPIEDLALGLLVLEDRLDHEVAIGVFVEAFGGAEVRQSGDGLRLAVKAAANALFEQCFELADRSVRTALVLIAEKHLVAGQGEYQRDLRSHHAGADDPDPAECHPAVLPASQFPFCLTRALELHVVEQNCMQFGDFIEGQFCITQ
jgi:hypothetical protein